MNPAELKDVIVSSFAPLNYLIQVAAAIVVVSAILTCMVREFGARRVKFL